MWSQKKELGDLRRIDETTYSYYSGIIKRRRDDFTDYLNNGGTLIVLVSHTDIFYDNYNSKSPRSVRDALGEKFTLAIGSGQVVMPKDEDDPVVRCLLRNKNSSVEYVAMIRDHDGKVLATNKIGQDIAVKYTYQGGGTLYLLPGEINFNHQEDLEAAVEELLAEIEKKHQNKTLPEMPEWSRGYVSNQEHSDKEALEVANEEFNKAKISLHSAQDAYDETVNLKRLFTGTGGEIEAGVNKLLEALGGKVIKQPESNRTDHVAEFKSKTAIVAEAKGVKKACSEGYGTQLDKWVGEYFAERKKTPKGLLVVNGWKDLEPGKRTEQVFPKHIIDYATSRGYCLMTGIQAFNIIRAVGEKREEAQNILQKIVDTNGRLEGYDSLEDIKSVPESPE